MKAVAQAFSAGAGKCWRMVYTASDAPPAPRDGDPMPEPHPMDGLIPGADTAKRVKDYSQDEHVKGLEIVRPVHRQ